MLTARFPYWAPIPVTADPNGNVFIASISSVRKISPNGQVETIAGHPNQTGHVDGPGETARFGDVHVLQGAYDYGISALALDPAGNLYATDIYGLRQIKPIGSTWFVSTVTNFVDASGAPVSPVSLDSAIAFDRTGNLYSSLGGAIWKSSRSASGSQWVATRIAGSELESSWKDGPAVDARFGMLGGVYGLIGPLGLAVDSTGNIFVSDTVNSAIRKISTNGFVTTLAGGGVLNGAGLGSTVHLAHPDGIAVSPSGTVYFADAGSFCVKRGSSSPWIDASQISLDARTGVFKMTSIGPGDRRVALQTSTNLVDWTTASESMSVGTIDLRDTNLLTAKVRFYRTYFP